MISRLEWGPQWHAEGCKSMWGFPVWKIVHNFNFSRDDCSWNNELFHCSEVSIIWTYPFVTRLNYVPICSAKIISQFVKFLIKPLFKLWNDCNFTMFCCFIMIHGIGKSSWIPNEKPSTKQKFPPKWMYHNRFHTQWSKGRQNYHLNALEAHKTSCTPFMIPLLLKLI